MKFRFLQEQLTAYPVRLACRVLGVSPAGYYAWRQRPVSRQARRREDLAVKIRQVHQAHRRVYGSPRVHRALRAQGQVVSENTVAKLMRQQRIRAQSKKKFVPATTDSTHQHPVAANQLDRHFTVATCRAELNRVWVTDITYIPTDEGWLYLAGVLDLGSRKIVGWSMAEHMETDLVADALQMALGRRHPPAGLLHHSDRGVQYASDAYQHLLASWGMTGSMSGKGNCWDNACAESFWATLKTELVHQAHYATRDQARAAIFEYIEVFYNRQRLHSTLGYLSPEAFEASLN